MNICRKQHRNNHGPQWNAENTTQAEVSNGPNEQKIKLLIGDRSLAGLLELRQRRKIQGSIKTSKSK